MSMTNSIEFLHFFQAGCRIYKANTPLFAERIVGSSNVQKSGSAAKSRPYPNY